MGKKHFTEVQIAHELRQQEAGTPIAELTRTLALPGKPARVQLWLEGNRGSDTQRQSAQRTDT